MIRSDQVMPYWRRRMRDVRRPLSPGWAKLAAEHLDRAMEVVSSVRPGRTNSRLLKLEVRRARGQLHLLWLMQPEDRALALRLRELGYDLAATSTETCEVCGRHAPWLGPGRGEVLCEAHDAPF